MRHSLTAATLVAVALAAPRADAAKLVRGPYLQSATPTSMVVAWTTDVAGPSEVRWGPGPTALTEVATDAASSTRHFVKLTNLTPGATVHYAVMDGPSVLAGGDDEHRFATPPLAGTKKKFRAWVLGDSGTGGTAQQAVYDAMKQHVAGTPGAGVMLHMGDIAYDSGTEAEFTSNFFGAYPDTLRHVPVFPTLGNHEGANADSATQTGPYYDAFYLPKGGESGGEPSGTEAYYAFDWANVHFIVLDSQDTSRSPTGAMATWLKADLMATSQPWIIAYWHHPPYTKGSHDSDTEGQLVDMRKTFLPILEAGGVDLVLAGHSHIYERSYLIDGAYDTPTTSAGKLVDSGDGRPAGAGPYKKPSGNAAHKGAVYVVAGHGGAGVSKASTHPVMLVSEATNGSCFLDVQDNRVSMRNVRQTGVVSDTFTVVKGDAIVVAAPDGGESLAGGSSFQVKWATVGAASSTVDLDLSLDDGTTWAPIAVGAPNSGTYAWTVPLVDTRVALVRVRDATRSDESNAGFTISSAKPVVAVTSGDVWSYDDTGVDPGATWMQPAFADAAWKKGPSQLGFGDGDEATVVGKTSPSYYFRRHFGVAGKVVDASVKVTHDDGVAVFVNGKEVLKKDVGSLAHASFATAQSADNEVTTASVDPSAFVTGDNVIAAVVKQVNASSSDVSFDLELTTTVAAVGGGGAAGAGQAGAGGTSAGAAGSLGGGAGGAAAGGGGAAGGAGAPAGGAGNAGSSIGGASGKAGAAGAVGAAAAAGATQATFAAPTDSGGGCGCVVVGRERPASGGPAMMALAALAYARVRRKRGSC